MSNNQSTRQIKSHLKPLSDENNQPVFDEHWQAQALAMADLLIQSKLIDSTQWSEILGKHLNLLQTQTADNQTSYYLAVLESLSELIIQENLLSTKQISTREQAWKQAYLSTEHGQPVKLPNG